MTATEKLSPAQTAALVEEFELGPWKSGPLSGTTFVAQETVDIEERITGCGNPDWTRERAPAAVNATAIDLLLSAGAQCLGSARVDELGIGLSGESCFYATPLNPSFPDRVPGGAAAGCASAVACGLVDAGLATDCGASLTIPASNCGLYAWTATPGVVPLAGMLPVSPSFDRAGVLARSPEVAASYASVVSSGALRANKSIQKLVLLAEAFDQVEQGTRTCLVERVEELAARALLEIEWRSLAEFCRDSEDGRLYRWYHTYSEIFYAEFLNSFGSWIEARHPQLGRESEVVFHHSRRLDRTNLASHYSRAKRLGGIVARMLDDTLALCLPGAPSPPPPKGFIAADKDLGDYYARALGLAAIPALSGCPQVTAPCWSTGDGPLGVTLVGAAGQDLDLIELARRLAAS